MFYSIQEATALLSYKSIEGFIRNFSEVIGKVPDEQISKDELTAFCIAISTPQRGRSGAITEAALSFIGKGLQPEKSTITEKTTEQKAKAEKKEVKVFSKKVEKLDKKNVLMYVLFFCNTLAVVYSSVFFLNDVGFIFSCFYTLVSIHTILVATDRKKQQVAKDAFTFLVLLEILAGCFHYWLFDYRLQKVQGLEASSVFWFALFGSAFMSACALYAARTIRVTAKEKWEAEQFEETYKLKY